jgi:hypothetical protein
MKRLFFLAAVLVSMISAQATVLRVNNIEGIDAPYKTIDAALLDAASGDTIMLEGSPTSYGKFTIKIPVTIIGPGYWQVKNGIMAEGANEAYTQNIFVEAPNVTIHGINMAYLRVYNKHCVATRCKMSGVSYHIVTTQGVIEMKGDNSVISQCVIGGSIVVDGGTSNRTTDHQITNNIFNADSQQEDPRIDIAQLDNSYIAYNTFRGKLAFGSCSATSVEYNIWSEEPSSSSTNSVGTNQIYSFGKLLTKDSTDKDFYEHEGTLNVRDTFGAFAGDNPYVLSGIPTGPVITDIEMPTTVEVGSKLNVTLKVAVSK